MKKILLAVISLIFICLPVTAGQDKSAVTEQNKSAVSEPNQPPEPEEPNTSPEKPQLGKLVVDIFDTYTNKPTSARGRLFNYSLSFHKPEARLRIGGKDLDVYYKTGEKTEELFYSPSHFETQLPVGAYNFLVEKGFEYYPCEKDFHILADQTTSIKVDLVRWVDMAKEGWLSGDYHNHFDRTAPGSSAEILEILKAEDLKIAYSMVSQFGGKLREVQPTFGKASVDSNDGYYIISGEEFTHDTLGHMAFIDIPKLIEPVATGARRRTDTKADYPTNYQVAKKAKEAGGTVFACHGGAGEFPVDLALGVIDGIEVLQGSKWIRISDSGKQMLLSPSWYHALNCGFKIPGVAASDYAYLTHKVVNLECNYVYVKDKLTPEAWLDGLKKGHAFMVKGPMMLNFTVNGQMMGETIKLDKPNQDVELKISLRARFPFKQLQIIRNGMIIRDYHNKERRSNFEHTEKIPVRRSCWFVVRAIAFDSSNPLRGEFLVHSNPVYVDVEGKPALVAESVIWWIDKIDELIDWTNRDAIFDRPEDKKQTLEIYNKAKTCYENLLAKCPQ